MMIAAWEDCIEGVLMSHKEIETENDRNWSDWRKEDINYFVLALVGEAGELANATKKYLRWKMGWKKNFLTPEQFLEKLKDELPDIQIYLSLIAGKYGLNLEELVREKQKVNRIRFDWKPEERQMPKEIEKCQTFKT